MGSSSAVERSVTAASGESELTVGAARSALSRRLLDSLLHDVRNPLNALSINLDVLTEKLRREQGEIPPAQEKNLKVMREQIFRVDAILRQFSEYMAPRPEQGGPRPADLSEIVRECLVVLGHESRRAMIKVRQMVEPDLKVKGAATSIRFMALQSIFRALARSGQEGEVDVTLQRDGDRAVLRVKDNAAEDLEPFPQAPLALQALAVDCGAELRVHGSELSLQFSINS